MKGKQGEGKKSFGKTCKHQGKGSKGWTVKDKQGYASGDYKLRS